MDNSVTLNLIRKTADLYIKGEQGETLFRQEEFKNSSFTSIKKHTGDSSAKFSWILPTMLAFPFNPIDTTDTFFTSRNKFVLKTDALNGWLAIKSQMRESEDLHKFYAKLLGVTPEEYNIEPKMEYLPDGSQYEYVTSQDLQLINTFKIPAQLSMLTQKIETSAMGPYGREFKSPLTLDGDNQIKEDCKGTIAYQLLTLEQEIRAEKYAKFYLEHDRSSLTQDDQKDKDTIRQSLQVKSPRLSGVIVYQELEKEKSSQKIKDLSKEEATLEGTLTYMNCAKNTLDQLQRLISTKLDSYPNYLILNTEYGNVPDKSAKDYYINLAKSRTTTLTDIEDWRKYTNKFIDYFMESNDLKTKEKTITVLANQLKYKDPRTTLGETTLEEGELFHDPITGEERIANILDVMISKIQNFDLKYAEYNAQNIEELYEKIVKANVPKYKPMADASLLQAYSPRVAEIRQYITSEIFDNYQGIFSQAAPQTFAELKKDYLNNKLPASYRNTVQGTSVEVEQSQQAIEASLAEMDKLDKEETGTLPEQEELDIDTSKLENVKSVDFSE